MCCSMGTVWAEVNIEMLEDDGDECDDESVKHDEDEDKRDKMSRVVDEEISSLLLATV